MIGSYMIELEMIFPSRSRASGFGIRDKKWLSGY